MSQLTLHVRSVAALQLHDLAQTETRQVVPYSGTLDRYLMCCCHCCHPCGTYTSRRTVFVDVSKELCCQQPITAWTGNTRNMAEASIACMASTPMPCPQHHMQCSIITLSCGHVAGEVGYWVCTRLQGLVVAWHRTMTTIMCMAPARARLHKHTQVIHRCILASSPTGCTQEAVVRACA
jgi:hypothetical protein